MRLKIDLPKHHQAPNIITSRDAVKNLIDAAFARHGMAMHPRTPARYGFGIIAHPVDTRNPRRLYALERIIVGSSDPDFGAALAQWTSDDLFEPNAVPGTGLDFREASIRQEPSPVVGEAIALYPISPIRVLDATTGQSLLAIDTAWQHALNRTMQTRFHRPFHLTMIPDSGYMRAQRGHITAHMAVKIRTDGYVVAYPGLIIPHILTGPADELTIAWTSGLGSSTAMGFGCLEVAHL